MSFTQGIFRVLHFVLLSLLWYVGMWIIAVPVTLWYGYRFFAWELVVLGFLLDVQFLTDGYVPYYTLWFLGLILFAWWVKPRLRAQSSLYEME